MNRQIRKLRNWVLSQNNESPNSQVNCGTIGFVSQKRYMRMRIANARRSCAWRLRPQRARGEEVTFGQREASPHFGAQARGGVPVDLPAAGFAHNRDAVIARGASNIRS
jgi:hypothetical protein